MMTRLIFAPFIIAVLVTVMDVAQAGDSCNPFPTCQSCLEHPHCGWCSHDVIYKDGSPGARCAGFEENGTTPGFVCNGLFSTEQCLQGYTCNFSTFVCQLAPEGSGDPIDVCEQQCGGGPVPSPPPPPVAPASVYLCNSSTQECYEVPHGTVNATSRYLCDIMCNNSVGPSPGPEPAPVYLCNRSTLQCEQTFPGNKGATSKDLCEQECSSRADVYQCDIANNYTCVPSPSGQPGVPLSYCQAHCFEQYLCDTNSYTCRKVTGGGVPKETCMESCVEPTPVPGTPPELNGLWRGVQINAGHGVGEWDIEFDSGNFKIYLAGLGVVTGTVLYNPLNFDLNLRCVSGPWSGKTILALYAFETPGPETSFLTIAFGPLDGARPTSIISALSNKDGMVFSLGKCLPNTLCHWTFPPESVRRFLTADAQAHSLPWRFGVNDPCSPWPTCSDCLSHEFCGWCSVPVKYSNGTIGKRCAQVSNPSGQFKCEGTFRTANCMDYRCNTTTYQCMEVEAGTGQPLELCQNNCQPPPEGYMCNSTSLKCQRVPPNSGGVSIQQCEIICKSHTGPPPKLYGQWRGVAIENGYRIGEVDVSFTDSTVSVVLQSSSGSVPLFSGDIYTQGDALTIAVTSGKGVGSVLTGLYTVTPATLDFVTLALSGPNGPAPQGYDGLPMTGGPSGSEYILVKAM